MNENFASLAAAIDVTSGGGSTVYTAGGGLRLDGNTFSREEDQRLPKSCADGDSAH